MSARVGHKNRRTCECGQKGVVHVDGVPLYNHLFGAAHIAWTEGRTPGARLKSLSTMERRMLRLLVQGYGWTNVSACLGYSEHTVRTYARRMYAKLGIHCHLNLIPLVLAWVGVDEKTLLDAIGGDT